MPVKNLFAELRRRNVFRVAGVYAVVGWLLAQVAVTLEEALSLPGWFDTVVVSALLIGFPVAIMLAWAFDLTPEGVTRTEAIGPGESVAPETGRPLDYAILAGLTLVVAIAVWQQMTKPDVVYVTEEGSTSASTRAQRREPGRSTAAR